MTLSGGDAKSELTDFAPQLVISAGFSCVGVLAHGQHFIKLNWPWREAQRVKRKT